MCLKLHVMDKTLETLRSLLACHGCIETQTTNYWWESQEIYSLKNTVDYVTQACGILCDIGKL